MHFSTLLLAGFSILSSAEVLVSYNASAGDPTSNLDLLNLEGWEGADWPVGAPENSSLAGNFFPGGATGAASPKVGLYGNKNAVTNDSYIYNVVVRTTLDDIKEVAGIA